MAPMLRHLPNLITLLRMLLVVPLCWLIADGHYDGALVVAAIAGLSDAVDGFLAKRYGWQSWLGGILDPIADKLLLMAGFLWLAFAGDVPGWLAALVIGRDLVIVGGAVAYYYLIGRFDAAPSRLSKLTTLVQIVFVLADLAAALASDRDAGRRAHGRDRIHRAADVCERRALCRGLERARVATHACARTEAGVSGTRSTSRWQWLILIGIVGFVIWLLAPVLMPFVIAALFAYLGDPLVDRLEKRMTRTLAVCLVFLVMVIVVVAILLVLVPFIERQIGNFLAQLPTWIAVVPDDCRAVARGASRRFDRRARHAAADRHAAGALEGSRRLRDDRARASFQVRAHGRRLGAQHRIDPGRRVLSAARLGHHGRAHPCAGAALDRAGRRAPRARIGRRARRIPARSAQRDGRARRPVWRRPLARSASASVR